MRILFSLIALALVTLSLPAFGKSVGDCHIGAYRLRDGSFVDIAASTGEKLRWRRLDGTTGALRKVQYETWKSSFGWTDRPDGKTVVFADCEAGKIRFDGKPGKRIAFDVNDVTFRGRDVDLAGRLVLPRGNSPVPIVVLVHGAENSSALDDYALQRIFPAEGIGAFVYDKRGTGKSGGKYTHDFDVLADDAVAAMREARRIAGRRVGRVGYQGGSQAGWIIPLAAARAPVDFSIVCFGLAVTIIDEDQQEVALEMKVKGYNSDVIAKALEVADAAEKIFASRFTEGFEHFDAVRARYRNEPWYKDVHGNYTYMILPYDTAELREMGKQFDFATPFHYDPMPALRRVTVPQLWILGEDDFEAPSAETSRRIKALIAEGQPITLALYPRAEHGMTEYETKADGERVSTRYVAGYFAMMRDFARSGELKGIYRTSEITKPRQ